MSETHEENKALDHQAKINEDVSEQVKRIMAEAKDGEELRIGVYVCQCGGNISDVVRTDLVAKEMEKLPNVVVSHDYIFMCSDSGQELIKKDIAEKGINRVVIGSCSPFLHEQTFRGAIASAGLNPYLYYHVGIREQASWVHHDNPDEATELSARLMASGIAKARLLNPLESIKIDAKRHALVIGGGVAGLQAALSIVKAGLKVTLVEKSHFLGGRMSQWDRIFPTDDDARSLLHGLISDVLNSPNITIHTGTEVTAAKGYIGDFNIHCKQMPRGVAEKFEKLQAAMDVCPVEVVDDFNFGLSKRKAIYRPYEGCLPSGAVIDWKNCTKCGKCQEVGGADKIDLKGEPIEFDLNVGAVVVATGFTPYEPYQGEFGYGEIPEVITLPQLERLLVADGPTKGKLEWNGHPIHSMAMIHCVGSRQIDGVHQPQPDGKVNDYCSRVCCTATLSAANHIRKQLPNVNIFDLYQDIRTYGRGHEEYYINASKNRVTFLRYYGDEIPEVKKAPAGEKYPILVKVKDHLTWGSEIEMPVDMVVLAVGMMPSPVQDLIEMLKISQGSDRFLLEVHPKLRPVETAIAGVVLAGTAQGPMNIRESSTAGQAAAAKVVALLNTGRVELEPYIVKVDAERCNGSGECVKYCPQDDAIRLETFTENGKTFQRAVVAPANCNGCGVCVSVCPTHALGIQGWTLDQYSAMVSALTVDISQLEGAL
jgi:heterodisulfide reductase subunit A